MMHDRFAGVLSMALLGALAWVAPAGTQDQKTIFFDVLLPAGASLEIDGYKTVSRGERRTYETPAVAAGKTYAYTLTAVDGGKKVVKKILLTADGNLVVDLRPDFAAAKPKPEKPALLKGPEK